LRARRSRTISLDTSEEAEIILLDARRGTPAVPTIWRRRPQRSLEQLGVEVKTGVMVKDVEEKV